MRKGRVEEASSALAKRIGKTIENRNKTRLRTRLCAKLETKDMWAAVRQLTGRTRETSPVEDISAETLNNHYAFISTDPDYTIPRCKFSAKPVEDEYFTEWQVSRKLDRLRPTATGLDALPVWFLKIGAPVFCKPITRLYNLPIATSTVPQQWKTASIKPIPKVTTPKQLADYRPISITPVLTRVMERLVVTQYIPMFPGSATKSVIHRPIRLSTYRLTNSCHNSSTAHNNASSHYQSICCCNIS